jgi:hypothetical protein
MGRLAGTAKGGWLAIIVAGHGQVGFGPIVQDRKEPANVFDNLSRVLAGQLSPKMRLPQGDGPID